MAEQHHYPIYGCSLASSIRIPELTEFSSGSAPQHLERLTFVVDRDSPAPTITDWKPQWETPAGDVWMEINVASNKEFELRFPNIARFSVQVATSDHLDATIRCFPDTAIPDDTLRHILLDQVLPLIFSCVGRVVMHMAVVKVAEHGIGFLGKSGQGKSTLTAEFSRNGYEGLSDDTVLISKSQDPAERSSTPRYCALANYPGIRLWSDSHEQLLSESDYSSAAHYTSKRRVIANKLKFSTDSVPILAFYALNPPDTEAPDSIRITRLGFGQSVKQIVESKYRLLGNDKQPLKDEFEHIADLASQIPCFSVAYPRDYARIGEVRESIVAHAESLAAR